jgi:DNA-binding NarL/FixJ family response regulator
MNFTKSLSKHIAKLVGTLRSEEQLEEILKRKFTKKEYKIFVAFEEGKTIEEIKTIVKDDEEKIQEHFKVACKKLNQQKIKQELVSFE